MPHYYMHPDLSLPEDASVIWRYLDVWKFEDMIKKRSLFFSRADEQNDKDEGTYPNPILAELDKRFGSFPSADGNTYTFHEWHVQKERRSRLVSCWTLAPESNQAWDIYTKSSNSVAVCSSIGRLKRCFHDHQEPVVWIGKVRYGERENTLPSSFHKWNVNVFLYPFFAKNEAYRWEREVRATVNIALARQADFDSNERGCNIKADLQIIIESLLLHPRAAPDLKTKILALLDSHGFRDAEINQSTWDRLP